MSYRDHPLVVRIFAWAVTIGGTAWCIHSLATLPA